MRGFSLVELALVLVIIGLVAGGIMAGSSMIHASQLKAIPTELQAIVVATQTFRDEYGKLPGDLDRATRYWGRMNNNADCVTNSGASVDAAGTCDGDGDGDIGNAAAASESGEKFALWRHLALAGLMEGSYTGLAGSGGVNDSKLQENVPSSKAGNTIGWSVHDWGKVEDSTSIFDGIYEVSLIVGAETTASMTQDDFLTPEEMWSIDKKMDDGMPAVGSVVPRVRGNCTDKTIALADSDDLNAVYNLTNTDEDCAIVFRNML